MKIDIAIGTNAMPPGDSHVGKIERETKTSLFLYRDRQRVDIIELVICFWHCNSHFVSFLLATEQDFSLKRASIPDALTFREIRLSN